MGESFQSIREFVKKTWKQKDIAGDWGVDKSHGGEHKIRGGVLSWDVLLRGVKFSAKQRVLTVMMITKKNYL